MTSELVTARHLCRKAMIYIRQSTPNQVATNQESLRLQYALRQRATELGWEDTNIELVDVVLGLSGATLSHREGFKDVIARVTLGEVGIILSYEVTRLARNCSDWVPLARSVRISTMRSAIAMAYMIRVLRTDAFCWG
jgi:DNA invertase Pin-like site-specific DNA recombinase